MSALPDRTLRRPRTTRTAVAVLTAGATALALAGATTAAAATPTTAASATPTPDPAATSTTVPGWAATSTRALSLVGATSMGPAPASRPVRLSVTLAPRDAAGLKALIRAQATPGSSTYEHYLTPAQFTDRFSPSAAQAQAVADHLTSHGFTSVAITPNRLAVTATGTAAQASSAFHTTLGLFHQSGTTVMANTTPALVPTALAGVVQSVLGLEDIAAHTSHVVAHPAAGTPATSGSSVAPAAGTPSLAGFTPTQLAMIYHVWGLPTATTTSIGIITQGDMTPTIADLRTAESKNHLPVVPVSVVYAGIKSPDVAGADEWDLDTQTSTAVAGTVKRLYLYTATSLTDADLYRAISLFVTQDVALSGSASLGECDALAYASGFMFANDAVLAQAAAQGQTFFASSGDTGSSCAVAPTNGVPGAGVPDTEYPASGTYTTGVGGTTLLAGADNVYQSEIAWNAGGGGLSALEFPGYWTAKANTASAGGVRAVPDVAADADPNTGAIIYVGGAPETIGGTSLSSPLWAGVWARMQNAHGNTLGFAPLKLYGLYDKANAATTVPVAGAGFHDVTLGSNGAFTALPGYDETTGLGSPDMKALNTALK